MEFSYGMMKKMSDKKIWVSLVLVALLVGAWYLWPVPPEQENKTQQRIMMQENLPEALQVVDLKVGAGAEAEPGKTVLVHYVGTLEDGTKFDSSRDRGQPFAFNLGAGQVIPGWEEGVSGMREGGLRKLVIPSGLAYGDAGIPGAIPPKATLIFEVELLEVR